ncbi:MAG: amidohydrolase family protein [Pseudomonadales bacterium]|nr:amidohydrolase family protein [Pseudomonadales bacterium]
MSHDLIIRNGNIVDGLGRAPVIGDIAIEGNRIVAIGSVSGKGKRELDAGGLVVTPGFVDLHTHFDAQVGWDPQLTPASWHGVTTALMGNCGVTFAPVRDADKETLAIMMESVEDIPRHAIMTGLSWNWNSYGEYLDSIEKLSPAINLAGMVGHAAARFYVMGERAVDENPTGSEIDAMASLIGDSVREGAVGFSTNRLRAHVMPDGRPIPGTFATDEELVKISAAVGREGGILQSVIEGGAKLEAELQLIKKQLTAARTRLLFSAPWEPGKDGKSAYQPAINDMQSHGLDVMGTTQPRAAAFLSGLKSIVLYGMRHKGQAWRDLRDLDFEGRLAAIRDSNMRARLIEEAKVMEGAQSIGQTMTSSRFSIPPAASFWMGDEDRPNYTGGSEMSLETLSAQANEHPAETWIRLMVESNGQGLFMVRFVNQDLEVLPDFMRSDWIVPGVGDAGAHVSVIMDSGWTSFLLSYWHRDRSEFTLEEAVHYLTAKQARVIGLNDRGSLEVGKYADINVIDIDRLSEKQPMRVHDFPGGAPRFIQRAIGYRATVVNGKVILENDELTGVVGGSVLRNSV